MRTKLYCLLTGLVLAAPAAFGEVSDDDIEQLRRELAVLSDRLDVLAAENAELKRSQAQAAEAVAEVPKTQGRPAKLTGGQSWADRIALKGDLRLRYEAIDEEGEMDRARGRYRARIGLSADVMDGVKVVAQLASGADDPVTRNQTFDGGFTTKDFGVDLIYAEWAINESLRFIGGKMSNPFYRPGGSSLVWDSDVNPEGIALGYRSNMFFGTLANFSVEERSSTDDSLLLSLQGGLSLNIAGSGKLTAGFGYYDYTNTIGNEPFYDGNANGNTVDAQGNLVFDYNELEIFAQYDTELGDLPFSVYADFVRNTEVDVYDSGYAFGVTAGRASSPGSWEAGWSYQDIEVDAVIGTFNDSDFGGGGTDATGHILKGRYVLRNNISIGGTLFINEIDHNAGTPHDYSRLQLDLEYNFN